MTLFLFAGELEGRRVVGAHSLLPDEQRRAAVLLDYISPWTIAMADEGGWMSAPVAPEIKTEEVMDRLSGNGVELEWDPNIVRTKVEAVLGKPATAALIGMDIEDYLELDLPD